MKPYFLDTSYILALENTKDQYHHAVVQHWHSLSTSSLTLLTTTYVIDEIVTFLNSRSMHQKAVTVAQYLLHSPVVGILHVDEELFFKGLDYFIEHADKRYSLTDCISFVVMQKQGITTAFTFDKHFLQAGFRTHSQEI